MLDLKVTDDGRLLVNSGKYQGTVFCIADYDDGYSVEFDLMMIDLQVVPTCIESDWTEFTEAVKELLEQVVKDYAYQIQGSR